MMASNQRRQFAASTDQIRNKYNTLTPAEAKKLNKFLGATAAAASSVNQVPASQQEQASQQQLFNLRQPPIRTASVLHKPRAPPIVVTNLDTTINQLEARNAACAGGGGGDPINFGSSNTLAASTISHQQHQHQHQTGHYGGPRSEADKALQLSRSSSIRSSSVNQRDSRRHTINYGRASMLNSRSSLYSARTNAPPSPDQHQQQLNFFNQDQQNQRQQAVSSAFNESISNLSFKSSLDTTDFVHDPYRLQTMSVDLGHQYYSTAAASTTGSSNNCQLLSSAIKSTIKPHHYDPMLRATTLGRMKYNTMSSTSSKMFSDESYSSARSECSAQSSCNATPTKFYNTTSVPSSNINHDRSGGGGGLGRARNAAFTDTDKMKPPRSDSKVSLTNSTYNKVFQSPFANFKKLFRNMPRPFAAAAHNSSKSMEPTTTTSSSAAEATLESQQYKSVSNNYFSRRQLKLDASCQSDKSLGDISISDSISQISLNQSQSPPVCPPPPGELKSMCYMESAINYSNYDEFTRARNERLAARQQAVSSKLNPNGFTSSNISRQQCDDQQQQQSNLISKSEQNDADSWQLTSLPVYYERNLTTVFEEKQASCDTTSGQKINNCANNGFNPTNGNCGGGDDNDLDKQQQQQQQQQHMIKPPMDFDDNALRQSSDIANDIDDDDDDSTLGKRHRSDHSSQSLTSSTTADSVLDFQQRKQQQHTFGIAAAPLPLPPPTPPPAKPYRFSFAQPLDQTPTYDQVSFQKDRGLPPRMPTGQQTATANSETVNNHRLDNSSSGNSSNCSSQLNGINIRDRPNSLETNSDEKNSYSDESTTSHTNLNDTFNNDSADVTILSETSTLQGDTGVTYYANKCAELERTVATLKNKLISKEKELTELQLSQLTTDYTIERLKKQVNKLERENAQLKTIVAKSQ